MKKSILREKSKSFALRIVKMYEYLQGERKEYVMAKQILRSGTSIGANIAEGWGRIHDFRLRRTPQTPYIINQNYKRQNPITQLHHSSL